MGRRYGRALFASAQARGQAEEVGRELAVVSGLLETEPALRRFLRSPVVTEAEKGGLLTRALGAHVGPLTMEFLQLLIAKRRLAHLASVQEAYHQLLLEDQGVVEATVRSAREMDRGDLAALGRELARITGKKIELKQETDPALLGGVAVYLEGRVVDGSLRTRLDRLREWLHGVWVHGESLGETDGV